MIKAVLAGLASGLVAVALGVAGSYLFYDPPVSTLPDGSTVVNVAVILGLVVLFGLGFSGGYSSVRGR